MDIKNQVGQLLMCGFDGLEATKGILDLIRHHNLGSVILFSRNIQSPQQVQQLTQTLQRAAKEAGHERPLWIAVDQENGVVRRLGASGTYLPGGMALGAIGSAAVAHQVAEATAKELLSLGIQWNLAPVMDVNSNPLNPVIGVRSFGEDADRVGQLGCAQIEGYQAQGVAACIKHFPGHGDTATDSHLDVPVIDKSLQELERVELVPFKQAISAQGDACPSSVMIAHISLPQLIGKEVVSSLSSEIVTDLLRQKLGYQGVIVTDCLEMNAVKQTVGSAQGALMALEAGNDMVMICHTLEFQKEAVDLIQKEMTAGRLNPARIRGSLDRVAAMKDKFLDWKDVLETKDLSVIGCKPHLELSDRCYDQVPAVVRDEDKLLPIRPLPTDKIVLLAAHVPLTLAIDSEPEPFNSMYASLHHRHPLTEYIIFNQDTYQDLTTKISQADCVIVGTANANLYPFQSELVKLAKTCAKKLIVAAVINPYDLTVFPDISTYLVTFEYTPPAHEALVRMLFGEISSCPKRLPVRLPNTLQAARFEVDDFQKAQDLESAYALWQSVWGETWPLSFSHFSKVLVQMKQPAHFVVRDGQRIIGFAATQQVENEGQLALLMVHPDYRRQGIGSRLNDHCMALFRQRGTQRVQLGATYPRFFCGLPNEDELDFFKRRGYIFGNKVWDLMGDSSGYEMPTDIITRMEKEGIRFETLKDQKECADLMTFEQTYFDFWTATFRHHAQLGDYQDLLVARNNKEEIVASLILYTAQGSHEARTDLIWTEIFGDLSGGMACVGVAEEYRGKGIGLGIVAHANKLLKERGVIKSYVDWVELVDFYRRTGYQTWRSYRLASI